MATITPFVKRMRTQGGTIYTFSSALEDIGLNINERNNIVKMSHFALLNIPSIDAPDNMQQNRFNVLAIPGAYEMFGASIKDGRIIVAESFQNYALNLETNLLGQNSYNASLQTTISERVFWKWLKETGAIRWTSIDTSAGKYWKEETDTDSSVGYNSVVKCIGQISAGSVRTDTFGTYNETYVLVPTSFGQTPVYFKQVEDDNYKHGISIINGNTNILGRESYLKPHPDALDITAYYDLADSSLSVTNYVSTYTMQYDNSTGSWNNGWWWTFENLPITYDNNYYTDSSEYIASGIYNINLQYVEPGIQFKRSKVDCLSIEYNLDNLKTIFGDSALTFDSLALPAPNGYSEDDAFDFNAIMIYYSVYNKALDTVLATNLLGVLFLDPPSGNTQNYPLNEITLPSITKLQSGPSGFGTSYSFRLNIKSDYMLDDTQAIVTDTTSSQEILTDFSQVFDSLNKTLVILNQQTGTISYITEQYLDITANQTEIENQISDLQYQINTGTLGISGTPNAIPMFSNNGKTLVDCSIYMKYGNLGFFTNNPLYPAQFDVSVKIKDLILENAIRDTSGNVLLEYGSPLQFGSKTNDRGITFYSGSITPYLTIGDGSISFEVPVVFNAGYTGAGSGGDVSKAYVDAQDNYIKAAYIPSASLGVGLLWNNGYLDACAGGSGGSSYATFSYVDASLLIRDASISLIKATYIPNASLNVSYFKWVGGYLEPSSLSGGVTKAYVDSSLLVRDVSMVYINTRRVITETSVGTLTARANNTDASIILIKATYVPSASIGAGFSWNTGNNTWYVDVSLPAGGVTIGYVDGSLASRDALIAASEVSINKLDASTKYWKPYTDGSLSIRDASIVLIKATYIPNASLNVSYFTWVGGYLEPSISGSGTTKVYVDGSLSLRDVSIANVKLYVDASLLVRDITIASLASTKANLLDPQLTGTPRSVTNANPYDASTQIATNQFVQTRVSILDTSISYLNTRGIVQDSSIGTLTTKLNTADASLYTLTLRHNTTEVSVGTLTVKLNSTDASIIYIKGIYIPNTSLGTGFYWSGGYLNASAGAGGGTGDVTKVYVDGSLLVRDIRIAAIEASLNDTTNADILYHRKLYVDSSLSIRDTSISNLSKKSVSSDASIVLVKATYLANSSLGSGFAWVGNQVIVDVSTVAGGVSKAYVDSSLLTRDVSIATLSLKISTNDTSTSTLTIRVNTTDASLATVRATYIPNASLNTSKFKWVAGILEPSIASPDVTKAYTDGSLGFRDTSISNLSTTKLNLTGGTLTGNLTINSSLFVQGDISVNRVRIGSFTLEPSGTSGLVFRSATTGLKLMYLDSSGNMLIRSNIVAYAGI